MSPKKAFPCENTCQRVLVVCLMSIAPVLSSSQSQKADTAHRDSSQLNRQKAAAASAEMDPLKQLDRSLQTLVAKVSPALVEIRVTGFGPVEDAQGNRTAVITRQSKLGSGVIIDPEGYIVTNAHVVANAQSIEIARTIAPAASPEEGEAKVSYTARLVGVHSETDLALLKIDGRDLPYLPLDAKLAAHTGQLVLALGNPEGLGNSVSMGVVSALDRQPDPAQPMVFIQTDAPINPGNSGGPLIDVNGHLMGINSMIVSSSGGSEGLGFAIPVSVVSFVVDKLRRFGHVDRSQIGAASEAITPLLAKGLNLPAGSGVFIVDVAPGGPAESAGLKINDVVLSVDAKPIRSLPQMAASLYLHPTDHLMDLEVLRGDRKIMLHVPVVQQKHAVDQLLDLADPQANLVRKLGILAVDVDSQSSELLPPLRVPSGVVVVANTTYGRAVDSGLRPGDVIHSLNNTPIMNLGQLQEQLKSVHSGAAVVLQIERDNSMDYAAFEMD